MKKRFFFLLVITFQVQFSNAQLLNESFSSTFPPTDWTRFLSNTANIPNFNNWIAVTVNIPPAATDYGAFASGQGPGSTTVSEKYLVTPMLKPVAGSDNLSFKLKRAGSPVPLYAKYLVKVSTTTNNNANDFTTVATYLEGFTTNTTTTFQTLTVNLSAYNNQNIYVAFVWNGNGDNGCYIDDVTGIPLAGAMPLKLINFSANPKNNRVFLEWNVAGDAPVTQFILEHSSDGNQWSGITKMGVAGTAYKFVHTTPALGRNYYRLAQKEKDGKLTYSPLRTALIGGKETFMPSVYPNPVTDHFSLDLGYAPISSVSYTFSGMKGEKVSTGIITLRQETIDVSKLSSGSYLLTLSTGHSLMVLKK